MTPNLDPNVYATPTDEQIDAFFESGPEYERLCSIRAHFYVLLLESQYRRDPKKIRRYENAIKYLNTMVQRLEEENVR